MTIGYVLRLLVAHDCGLKAAARRDELRSADEEEYGFNKTMVPVRLALEGSDGLVSRSQAKRLMARLDRFSTVVLDFTGVETIGRAFADEIFRVFARTHNGILLVPVHANPEVIGMITAVRSGQPERSS